MDSSQVIGELMKIAGRLIVLMNRECEILKSFETDKIGALQGEKTLLAIIYTKLTRELTREPEILAALSGAVRDELRSTLGAMEEAARENERAIGAARDANERVMAAVAEVAAQHQSPLSLYSRSGAPAVRTPRQVVPLSLSVDRNL